MEILIKKKLFKISKLKFSNINKDYINSLNNQYINHPSKTIKNQKKYVKFIRKKKGELLEITFKNKLIATSGFSIYKSKLFQGILIINKNFINKGYAKYFILYSAIYANKIFKKKKIYAGILNENINSKYSFINAGYKIIHKDKVGMYLVLNLNDILKKHIEY
jgi:hypothetical protein